MIKDESILQPVKTDESPSKAVQGAAKEPENWQKQGTTSVAEALANKRHVVNPGTLNQ
jgi:hypothetical protein